jgi:YbbR domain-containing protein
MNLKKSLTENIGVKLIALVVAMFVWFNASGQKEIVWLKMIPIVIENVPDSLVVSGSVPAEVEISITGTKRQLILTGLKRISLVVDLAGAAPGRHRVSLSSRNIRLPGNVDRHSIRILEPTSVDLMLERFMTRRVQVTLATSGSIPDNLYVLDGGISITPSWTYVRGAASQVQKIESVPTQAIELNKLKETLQKELPLDFDRGKLECRPDRVTVSVRVSAKGKRILPNVPPTVLVDSEDYDARVVPSTVSLTLEGASAVLDTLSSGDVSVLLNLSGRGAGVYRIVPEVILPPGAILAEMSAESLLVNIIDDSKPKSP